MPLSIDVWHQRFLEQARWTADLRADLFAKAGISGAKRILEVGCGTGAVLSTLAPQCAAWRIGLDIDLERLTFAQSIANGDAFLAGDANALPFPPQCLDIVFSHFLFLWLKQPRSALAEMRRVVRRHGAVISLAEPDYDARIDFPAALAEAGRRQRDALIFQGADPAMGRKMAALMAESGLRVAESGILGGRWEFPLDRKSRSGEWDMLRSDVGKGFSDSQWGKLLQADQAAWATGARVLFIPTFYCLAFREE